MSYGEQSVLILVQKCSDVIVQTCFISGMKSQISEIVSIYSSENVLAIKSKSIFWFSDLTAPFDMKGHMSL